MSTPTASSVTERTVAAIWADVLQLPEVGATDNFFDLGGHSLALHLVQERIVSDLGRELPLVDLFSCPTVRSLAAYLDRQSGEQSIGCQQSGSEEPDANGLRAVHVPPPERPRRAAARAVRVASRGGRRV